MKLSVGIDEVGRGPIAGPVVVASFVYTGKSFTQTFAVLQEKIGILQDSKKLSKTKRELWFQELSLLKENGECNFSYSFVSASVIDRIGISPAIKKALNQSLSKLDVPYDIYIVLDGGLKAPPEYRNQITIIKGDEKEPAISCASIVAKVMRDRYMERISKKLPQYGFENHVGYGTRFHYAALRKYGLTSIHRKSFLKKLTGQK